MRWGGGLRGGKRGHGESGQELPSLEWVQREGNWSISERHVALLVAPLLEPEGKTGSPQCWLACPHTDLSRSASNDQHHRGCAATCLREYCGLWHHAQKWTYLNTGGNHYRKTPELSCLWLTRLRQFSKPVTLGWSISQTHSQRWGSWFRLIDVCAMAFTPECAGTRITCVLVIYI